MRTFAQSNNCPISDITRRRNCAAARHRIACGSDFCPRKECRLSFARCSGSFGAEVVGADPALEGRRPDIRGDRGGMVPPFDPAVSRPDDDPRATGCVHPAFRTAAHNGAARLQSPRTPGGLGRRERRTGRQGDRAARRRHGVSQRRRGQAGAERRFLSLCAPRCRPRAATRCSPTCTRRTRPCLRRSAARSPGRRARFSRNALHHLNYPHQPLAPEHRARPDVYHPLERRHPKSGRVSLYHRPLGLRHRGTAGAGGTRADSVAAGVRDAAALCPSPPLARRRRDPVGQPLHAAQRDRGSTRAATPG